MRTLLLALSAAFLAFSCATVLGIEDGQRVEAPAAGGGGGGAVGGGASGGQGGDTSSSTGGGDACCQDSCALESNNLVAHYRATDLAVSSGGGVSVWGDSAGLNHLDPISSLPLPTFETDSPLGAVVRFTGNEGLSSSMPLSWSDPDQVTIFAAVETTSPQGITDLILRLGNATEFYLLQAVDQPALPMVFSYQFGQETGFLDTTLGNMLGGPVVVSARKLGTTLSTWTNGGDPAEQQAVDPMNFGTDARVRVGANTVGGTKWAGDVAEIIIYGVGLMDQTRADIEQCLMCCYDIERAR